MTWRRGEAGSTLIDRPKDAPVPDFTNGKERDNKNSPGSKYPLLSTLLGTLLGSFDVIFKISDLREISSV